MSETGPGADAAGGQEYFSSLEAEFIRRRGTPFLLSPKDFALMRRWRDLEIPIEDVLVGIDEAFDRREERQATGRVNSLSYCEAAVLEAWERGAAARVGRGGRPADPELPAEAILEELDGRLAEFAAREPRFQTAAERARASLTRIRSSGRSAEQVEESLARLEKKLLKDVEAGLAPPEAEALDTEVSRRLAAEAALMEPRAARRTSEILKRRKLRATFGVPALTLLWR